MMIDLGLMNRKPAAAAAFCSFGNNVVLSFLAALLLLMGLQPGRATRLPRARNLIMIYSPRYLAGIEHLPPSTPSSTSSSFATDVRALLPGNRARRTRTAEATFYVPLIAEPLW